MRATPHVYNSHQFDEYCTAENPPSTDKHQSREEEEEEEEVLTNSLSILYIPTEGRNKNQSEFGVPQKCKKRGPFGR
eukprot:2824365-Amphidinium_carterae.1